MSELEQQGGQWVETSTVGISADIKDIDVTEGGTGNGSLTVSFGRNLYDVYGADSPFYFKISEEHGEDQVIYDDSYYIVEITVEQDANGIYYSKVESIVKYDAYDNEIENPSDNKISFYNSLLSGVTILKVGADGKLLEGAVFHLYYEDNGTVYYCQLDDSGVNWIADWPFWQPVESGWASPGRGEGNASASCGTHF